MSMIQTNRHGFQVASISVEAHRLGGIALTLVGEDSGSGKRRTQVAVVILDAEHLEQVRAALNPVDGTAQAGALDTSHARE